MKKSVGFVATLLLLTSGWAWGASCQVSDVTWAGSDSKACQAGTQNNDNPLPGQVNDDNMFGMNNWQYLSKFDIGSGATGPVDIGLTVDSGTSGDWSVNADAFDGFQKVMIVLKGSNPNPFVGYLWDMPTAPTKGTFDTSNIFQNKQGKPQDLSHLSVYVTPVPIPAAVWLMGSGLLALVGIGRRNKLKS